MRPLTESDATAKTKAETFVREAEEVCRPPKREMRSKLMAAFDRLWENPNFVAAMKFLADR